MGEKNEFSRTIKMRCRPSEDNSTHERQTSTQGTVVDVHNSPYTMPTEWPWGLLVSDKHHVLFFSDKRRVTVGRSHDCDIIVDDPRISAVHFAIVLSLEVNVPSPGELQQYCHRNRSLPHCSSSSNALTSPWVVRNNCDSSVFEESITTSATLSGLRFQASPEVRVYLEDVSSNGTYVNDMVVGKGRRCQLLSGDDIGVVAIPSKVAREEWETMKLGMTKGNSSLIGVTEARLLANLPQSRSYVERFCFQAYHSPEISPVLNFPEQQKYEEEEEEEEEKEEKEKEHQVRQRLRRRKDDSVAMHKMVRYPFRSIRWQQGHPIGRGASSVVYAGIDLDTGQMVALKVIKQPEHISIYKGNSYNNKNEGTSLQCESKLLEAPHGPISHVSCSKNFYEKYRRQFCELDESLRELCFLTHLVHQRIVRCLGVQKAPEGVCIILEYVAGGTLRDLIKNFGAFHEKVIRLYTLQVLQGMEYLQSQGVVHGDLKSANVLMSEKGNLKITDFGTSRFVQNTYATHSNNNNNNNNNNNKEDQMEKNNFKSQSTTKRLYGTPLYMSPEFIRTQESTFASDVWALGCMVYEMAVGVPPWEEFHDLPPHSVVWKIGAAVEGPSLNRVRHSGASAALLSFLECTLHMDPHQRSSVAELLKHPLIAGRLCITSSPSVALFPATPPHFSQPASPSVLQIPSRCCKRSNSITGMGEFMQQKEGEEERKMCKSLTVSGGESDEIKQQEEEHQEQQDVNSQLPSLDLGTSANMALLRNDQDVMKPSSSPTNGVEDHKAFVYELCLKKILSEEDISGVDVGRNMLGESSSVMPSQRWRSEDSTYLQQQKNKTDDQEKNHKEEEMHDKSTIFPSSDGITGEFSGLIQMFRE